MSGRSLFLDAVSWNQVIVQYVQLFRMPLFLTMLDEEFKGYDDTVWENSDRTEEIVRKVMPGTLSEFGIPGEMTDQVIAQCLDTFATKKNG